MDQLREVSGVHLVLLGQGTQRTALEKQVVSANLSARVHFMPSVPLTTVSEYAADADLMVVSLKDDPLYRITVPSKTQAAFAQSRPVLCSAPGDVAVLVKRAGAGWTAEPDSPESIADAIRAAVEAGTKERESRGRRGRAFYVERMSRNVGSEQLSQGLCRAVRANSFC